MDTELSTYTDRELAQEFVDARIDHVPCYNLEQEINRRGVSSEELSMILYSYIVLGSPGFYSREEISYAIDSAVDDITAALFEASGS